MGLTMLGMGGVGGVTLQGLQLGTGGQAGLDGCGVGEVLVQPVLVEVEEGTTVLQADGVGAGRAEVKPTAARAMAEVEKRIMR